MEEAGISGWFRDGNWLTLEEFPDGTPLVLEDYLNRRRFLQVAASVPLASSAASGLLFPARADVSAFDRSIVRQMARDAASKPSRRRIPNCPNN